MRYLLLVSNWEKQNLAESLFAAIGVRVVDILHSQPKLIDTVTTTTNTHTSTAWNLLKKNTQKVVTMKSVTDTLQKNVQEQKEN